MHRVFFAIIFIYCSELASADGHVIVRKASIEEQAFIKTTKEKLKSLLPVNKSGWQIENESSLDAEDMLTFNTTEGPIEVSYSVELVRTEGLSERKNRYEQTEKEIEPARNKMNQLMEVVRQKVEDLNAAQQGDDRKIYESAKINLDKAQKDYDTFMESNNPIAVLNKAQRELERDTHITFKIVTNSRYFSISDIAEHINVPQTLRAIMVTPKFSGVDKAKIDLLFGQWKIDDTIADTNGGLRATFAPTKEDKLTTAYNLALSLQGDAERVRSLLSELNISQINAVVK